MLRDQDNEKIKDIRQICFICGHNKFVYFLIYVDFIFFYSKRELFDRKINLKGGFITHINVKTYIIIILKVINIERS